MIYHHSPPFPPLFPFPLRYLLPLDTPRGEEGASMKIPS
jgi:hypothetical protein